MREECGRACSRPGHVHTHSANSNSSLGRFSLGALLGHSHSLCCRGACVRGTRGAPNGVLWSQ